MTKKPLLGGLTPKEFLTKYWQKKPLLVRGAFPAWRDPVTADELAGLAMEEGISARLVMERGGAKPFEVRHGPFERQVLSGLPEAHWSLLVSRVNEWVPEASLILDHFDFVPGWRLDDLMVSFAPPSGTVGPHVDSYDVFLIQGQGRRRWGIATKFDPTPRAGLDLRVLKKFKATKEWILDPGDMLYLPPGVAHHGVALESCLTYSVGFRAPSVQGLMLDLLGIPPDGLARFGDDLYADPDLAPPRRAGEVDKAAVARVRALAQTALADDAVVGRWLAAAVTRPDPSQRPRPGSTPRSLATSLRQRTTWRADDVRVAWVEPGDETVRVFIAGDETVHPRSMIAVLEAFARTRKHAPGALLDAAGRQDKATKAATLALLTQLASSGALVFD